MYFLTDWTTRIDFDRLRRLRLEAVRRAMADHRLDAILAFKYENIRYITGLRPLWFPFVQIRNAAVVTPDRGPICFVNGGDWAHRHATMTWMDPKDVRILGPLEDSVLVRKSLPPLVAALEELGFRRGRLGVDVGTLYVLEALRAALPGAELADADEPLRAARLVKNPEEVRCMRMASACVDLAFEAAIRAVRPGVRECEILGEGKRAMYALGMEIPQCSSIVASGDNLAPLARFASDRPVMHGDLVFIDMGGCFNGMFAEATRTVICGEPSKEQRAIYKAVSQAMGAILETMRPGKTSEDIYQAARRVYSQHGLERYALATVLGHSIGVAGWEPPTIGDPSVTGATVTLAPGMIFSIEPTIIVPGLPGGGGVRLEEEVLITETGNEVLTRCPYDARLLA